jgi:hypothetical protein
VVADAHAWPAGHAWHTLDPAALNLPVPHGVQTLAPDRE